VVDRFVRSVAITRRGPDRTHNEDHVVVGPWVGGATMERPLTVEAEVPGGYLVAVADGLGGHSGGEVASGLVGSYLAAVSSRLTVPDRVVAAVATAHELVLERMRAAPELAGMGTTLAALLVTPTSLLVVNLGDSRVYEVNHGFLRQRSADDSPQLPPGSGPTSVVTSCLGVADAPVQPHVTELPLRPGRFLLCTDGLTDVVDTDGLEAAIDGDDEASVLRLLAAADAAGRHDDTSIVLVRIGRQEGAS
jgi:PPM family protein phosphatase